MAKRLVVLISGTGSNLQALLDHPDLGGTIALVAADRADAGGLERARRHGIAAAAVQLADHPDRKAWESALAAAVSAAEPDLVVLAGFMRILSGDFVRRWPIMNVHPSLLPAFPGARAVEEALHWGVKVTGATVHFVDEQVDHGPIIAQEAVAVTGDDTAETLHERIKSVEHRLLPHAVALFCHDRLTLEDRNVRIRP
ncbi:MAG TPA: phosphoribosylglycinamide formyltransferase [Egibacteraceae bacterium]|nr:phosphoribosylglycinamide formyltransferase [Egibacteraceae bacterium]